MHEVFLEDPKEAAAIRKKVEKFYHDVVLQTLCCKSHGGVLLHCLSKKEANKVLKETHGRTCPLTRTKIMGPHKKTWLFLAKNNHGCYGICKGHCQAYQVNANFIHQVLEYLYTSVVSWPFEI